MQVEGSKKAPLLVLLCSLEGTEGSGLSLTHRGEGSH